MPATVAQGTNRVAVARFTTSGALDTTFSNGDGDGDLRSVATEDAALVQFETDGGALGTVVVMTTPRW